MIFLRRGALFALACLSLPTSGFAAPASKNPAAAKNTLEPGHKQVEAGTVSSSVVTEEMRTANEAASNSAEAAIASLKAARAAIAAEKSRGGEVSEGKGGAEAAGIPVVGSQAAMTQKKGKAVEKLEPLPTKQDLPARTGGPSEPAESATGRANSQADSIKASGDLSASPAASSTTVPAGHRVDAGTVDKGKPLAPASTAVVQSPETQAPSDPKRGEVSSEASTSAGTTRGAPAVTSDPAGVPTQSVSKPSSGPGTSATSNVPTLPVTPNATSPVSAADAPSSVEAAAAAAAALASGTSSTGEALPGEVKKKSRFGGDDALGDAAKKKGKGKTKETVKLTPEQQKAVEIKAFCDKAREAIRRGEEEVARGLLESLVAVDLPHVEKKIALSEVAAVYEEKGDLTKAIAILEKLTTVLEGDTEVPAWLLKLGQLYREAGAYQMAISRYYGVIQLAMKVGSSDFQRFQAISRQAQREIANTYFMKGDFDQAQKFYNMALRSDLPKEERAVALFRAAHCTFMRNDMNGAINGLERFLKDHSRHASAAEARYMLATAYKIEGRPQDAYDSVIDLLRDAKSKAEENPKIWAFWQKKAGNEFANDYYQRGEFVNAVTIYQALAAIEESPEWRWPVVYQMGLCFERLRLEARAGECYKYIVDENKRPEFRWRKMPQSVANLVQMAAWRVEQLDWDSKVHSKLRAVAGADLARPVMKASRP